MRAKTCIQGSNPCRSAKTQAARPLAELLPVDKATSGKQATATGRYGTQLLVPDRELDGKNGYYVLTLLRTDGQHHQQERQSNQ